MYCYRFFASRIFIVTFNVEWDSNKTRRSFALRIMALYRQARAGWAGDDSSTTSGSIPPNGSVIINNNLQFTRATMVVGACA